MAGHCEGAGRARSEGIGELGVPGRCQASTPPSGRNACLRAHPSAADMTAAGLPAGFARLAPPLPGRALSQQQWRYVTFLHWQVDEHLVAKLLPAGTRPDLFDGVTYVGLVAFVMADAGLGVRRPVPWLGTFPETNVRFYSVDEQGRHGVVFASLEATRLATVLAARGVYQLPYTWAHMRVRQRGSTWWYHSDRRWPDVGPHSAMQIQQGSAVVPSPLEEFLTARWGLHHAVHIPGRRAPVTCWTANEHEPWPLFRAQLVHLDETLLAAAGLPRVGPPDLAPLWSPGVTTRFARPVPLT